MVLNKFEIERAIWHLRRTYKPTDKDDFRDEVMKGTRELERIGKPVLPRLISLLLNKNESVDLRGRIPGILANIGDPIAIAPLIQNLHEPNVFIRWSVVKGLGKLADSSLIPELERMVAEDTGEFPIARSMTLTIKDAAKEAIEKIKARQ